MGADHAYAFMPVSDRLALSGSDLDPAFFDGFQRSVQGLREGNFLFDDPMPMDMHRRRMAGGFSARQGRALSH